MYLKCVFESWMLIFEPRTFSLKDKVTAKVNELLEKDIIEKVEGPTTWVTPVVIAPKASGT